MPKRNVLYLVAILLAVTACWLLVPRFYSDSRVLHVPNPDAPQPLAELYQRIERTYAEPLEPRQRQQLIDAGARAMVQALGDPDSVYYPPEQADALMDQLHGRFGGLGLRLIETPDGGSAVDACLEPSPAFWAGVQPGDRIVRVAGRDSLALPPAKLAERVAAAPSPVALTLRRAGCEELIELAVAPAPAGSPVDPVQGLLPGSRTADRFLLATPAARLGYVRVLDFIESPEGSTITRFNAALMQLRAAGITGLIIDLRDNPGGSLGQAVQMVDRFVGEGAIITERSVHHEKVHRATAPGTLSDWPIVVLIDGDSASASELVAGSLSAHRRAVLVGQRTYGKGTKQEVIALPSIDGRSGVLKLTAAYLFLPDGRPFHRTLPGFYRPATTTGPDQAEPGEAARPSAGQDRRPTDSASSRDATGLATAASAADPAYQPGIAPQIEVVMSSNERLAAFCARRELALEATGRPATQPDRLTVHLVSSTRPDAAAQEGGAELTPSSRLLADPRYRAALLLANDPQFRAAADLLADPDRYRELTRPAQSPSPTDTRR